MRKSDGTPFKVFTPFHNAWLDHGWRKPADTDASTLDLIEPAHSAKLPAVKEKLPDAQRLREKFRDERLPGYDQTRDGTFRGELAWREFYADVLWHRPETARENYDRKFDRMKFDPDGAYVRRYAPDSLDIPPIVDHAVERQVALDRYQAIKP